MIADVYTLSPWDPVGPLAPSDPGEPWKIAISISEECKQQTNKQTDK